MVSHDLRAPLVTIQAFCRELEINCNELTGHLSGAGLDDSIQVPVHQILEANIPSALRFIKASTSKFEGLIDALLRLSRAGRVQYRWTRLDVGHIARSVLETLESQIQTKAAKVSIGSLPEAWGDATAVDQIFSNLLHNALQYLDPARPGRIQVEGELQPNGMCHYRVTDGPSTDTEAGSGPRVGRGWGRPSISPYRPPRKEIVLD